METFYRIAADGVVIIHLCFILFVFLGGLTLFWRPWMIWIHVPAALWGGMVELFGVYCPLTPLENHLRRAASAEAYSGGFVDHYIMPIVYPPGLTRETQVVLGVVILALNLTLYFIFFARKRKAGRTA
ncbi:MAG: DUF2784 domain-containing protein [Candidatus Krumholzibacteriota bacterium]